MTRSAPPNKSRTPALLGIDLGTSSVKVVAVTIDGSVIARAAADYPIDHPRPGWAESDPAAWWTAVADAVGRVASGGAANIRAIGLSGQMHGLVVVDRDAQPVRPAMLWSDFRAVDELDPYRRLPARVRARLANPLTPGMAGPMLAWVAGHEPDAYRAMRWALQPKDWLRARLTGEIHSEPSDASATLLYDIPGERWDLEVMEALGVDPELVPRILKSSGTRAGDLLPGAASALGLEPGIPVAAGAADTAAAALGSGLISPTDAQLTIGTGAQIVVPTASGQAPPKRPIDPVTHLYRRATDQGWYSMAAIVSGGLTLAWVRRMLSADWSELYAAAATPPAAEDPIFLPHLSGERTPYMDTGLRGSWAYLDLRHGRSALMRSALEGVAFAIREALDALAEADGSIEQLRLAGGGSTSPPWRQMLADITGCALYAADVPAASAKGAAFLGGRAAAMFDEESMLASLTPSAHLVAAPDESTTPIYTERRARFRRTVETLRK